MSERRSALDDVSDYEELWQAVLLTAVDPIIVIDGAGTIQHVNPATETLFGHAQRDLVGSNVSMLMPEPHRSAHDGYLSDYARTGEASIIGIGREVEARKADGSIFPIHLAVSATEHQGRVLYTGIVHDLSDLARQQAELLQLNENLERRVAERTHELERSTMELARSNRDLEQFAYIASHDLQAPLRNVRQGIELLDEHLQETSDHSFDDEATELQTLTFAAISRMEELIQGLLSFSRVDRKGARKDTSVDLAALVDDISSQIGFDLADHNATIERGELPVVVGDAVQLRQVMHNLIENSLKYRNAHEAPIIRIEATTGSDWVEISVTDNGIGIDPEHHERVFELFRRAHPGYDGVGLGLAICQRIIERHGGTIWIAANEEPGTTFSFRLPAATTPTTITDTEGVA